MNSSTAIRTQTPPLPLTEGEVLQLGREILGTEVRELANLMGKLDTSFNQAVRAIYELRGNLIVTGMGKAGLVGQKLAATFASTGTGAHFLHPAEAVHGDLGRIQEGDLVLVLSQSGETEEIVRLLPSLDQLGAKRLSITANSQSTLGQNSNITIELGKLEEACVHGLAPSTSTTVMLALGDALALVVSRLKGFEAVDFAKFHPGGSLGLQLSHVEDYMRSLDVCRIACADRTIRQVLATCTKPGRRTGAIMLTDEKGQLEGLFTDSDLVRLIESRNEEALDCPVRETMNTSPTTVSLGDKMLGAIDILAERKISEIPVIDSMGKPAGLIDVTDVLGLLPEPGPQKNIDSGTSSVLLFTADE